MKSETKPQEKCEHVSNEAGDWGIENGKSYAICGKCGERYETALMEREYPKLPTPSKVGEEATQMKLAAFCPDKSCDENCNYQSHYFHSKAKPDDCTHNLLKEFCIKDCGCRCHTPSNKPGDWEKVCTKCKISKPLSDFPKDRRNKDGRKMPCKSCSNQYCTTYYYRNRDAILKEEKETSKSSKKRAQRIKTSNSQALKFPEKVKARIMLRDAVKAGKIVKPKDCEHSDISSACSGRIEAHHPDYTKPFDVLWLCRTHHAMVHRKYDGATIVELVKSTKQRVRCKICQNERTVVRRKSTPKDHSFWCSECRKEVPQDMDFRREVDSKPLPKHQ